MAETAGVLRCRAGHSFDLARQGYVNLLAGGGSNLVSDTAEMVRAREAFLARGYFSPIAEAVSAAVSLPFPGGLTRDAGPDCVVDLGSGPGYYLSRVLDALAANTEPGGSAKLGARSEPVGLALDLSVPAARRAARSHRRIGAVVCDVWKPLPVRTGAASVLLSVFAPRNGTEMARILRPGGICVVATPTTHHLAELVTSLGLLRVDERKPERLRRQLAPVGNQIAESRHEKRVALTHSDIETVVGMGPSTWHADPEVLANRIATLPEPYETTLSIKVFTYLRTS